MTVAYDGKVGIKTTTPHNTLEIAGPGSTDALNINKGDGTAGILFTFNGTAYPSYIRTYEATALAGYMSFGVNTTSVTNTEVMRLQGNGNVGIGTTGPTQRLEVSGGNILVNTNGDTLLISSYKPASSSGHNVFI